MIISNIRITSYNTCKRQEAFRYSDGVEPRTYDLNITRGFIGHEALEAYYLEMREGSSVDLCKKAALAVLESHMNRIASECPEEFEQLTMIAELVNLLDAYIEHYRIEPFRVLEVEKVFTTPIDDQNNFYGMKLDLLVEFIMGMYRGDVAVYDHKFVYNFKSQQQLDMNGQLPKYVQTVRRNGYPITKGYLNQIRHRKLKNPKSEDIFRRVPIRTTPIEIDNIWSEQIGTALEIINNPAPPRRNLSEMICKGCFYQLPCKAELMGEDISTMLRVNFKPKSDAFVDIHSEG